MSAIISDFRVLHWRKMILKILATPVVVLAVICGYYLNMRVHPDISQPFVYRTLMGINAAMTDVVGIQNRPKLYQE